jgi:2-polyprenyl-6-methoxyphenol hydroxylase-like FAD-dependent oxidoreductase
MEKRDCVVVGGGPGGVVLAYLLARQGLRVTLLEARGDFARRFRGDSLAPAVLDWLDELGLGDDVLARPHAVADAFTWHTPRRAYRIADYSTASARHPHYVLLPQPEFLTLLTERAAAFPGFALEMSARVNGLVEEDGRVVGVRYRSGDGTAREVRAPLVVGADGRFSQMRRLGGFEVEELGAGLDILWFEVPRRPGDPPLSGLDYFSVPGRAVVALGQGAAWQLGYIIPTGTVAQAREAGIGPVVELTRRQLPWLGDRLDGFTDFSQLTLLTVRITRLPRWYRPGLLLLGDAAHVISPVGGNGINIAIADAADAGNTLPPALAAGPEAVDAACSAVEARRRAVSDAEQRTQVRTERGSVERLRAADPEPVWVLKIAAAIPPLARAIGRRSASAIAIPPPGPALLAVPQPAAATRSAGTGAEA